MARNQRAAVIGSGFGGLAIAIRLAAMGFKTVIFEKRDKPGGRAYVYEQDGFTFDAGPTVVTAPDCIAELFELASRPMADYVELMPVDPLYRLFWEDGDTFDYCRDEAALRAQIRKRSAADAAGYERYLAYAEQVYKEGYERLCHVAFPSFWDMVRVSPQLLRLAAYRSVYATVSKYIRDDHLRQALSFNSLLIGGNPFRASSIYTLIHPLEKKWGVFFPRGGTHALVQGLVKLFEDLGGEIRLEADVSEIETASGRVSGVSVAGKRAEPFDLVVSNADVVHTYDKLLKGHAKAKSRARRLKGMAQSMSLFVVYFGTNRKFPGQAQHSIYFGSRYRGLLDDIFDNGVLADDFSLYVHAPSVTDPSLAPPGCETFYALSPVPHLGKLAIDWQTAGPTYAARIIDYLDRRYLPGVKDAIVTQRIFTPQDFAQTLNAHVGSAFSLEPILTQSAYFRVHNRDKAIPGLYFVGAGTHPGAGIPGVIGSAKATAGVIAEHHELGAVGTGAREALCRPLESH